MYQAWRLKRIVSIIICFLLHAQGADEYTDENRPYEFGFKIDGQQHRHEKKDKDGIIMGEFGFITADDVYHVTVYATDKEGRFKILSMKNIHLKSSSINPTTSARQGHSLPLPPAIFNTPSPPQVPHVESVSFEPPGKACSSCSLPTTTTRAPQPAASIYNGNNNNYNTPNQFGPPQYQQGGDGSAGFGGQTDYRNQPNFIQQQPNIDQTYIQQNNAQGGTDQNPYTLQDVSARPNYSSGQRFSYGGLESNTQGDANPNLYESQGASGGQNYPGRGSVPYNNNLEQTAYPNYPGGENLGSQPGLGGSNVYAPQPTNNGETLPGQSGQQNPSFPYPGENSEVTHGSNRKSKQYNEQRYDSNVPNYSSQVATGPAKPALFAAQMQIVDKNTDIHHLNPGETHGLPPGLTKEDMVRLLYTFNYTLGFQGHFEEGYNNGVKKGYYFVTARNGVRMRIDYVADDTGFHPKVSQEVFDLLSEEVPKPETEKDEKYGLKGYEFKWLYYPVGSKKR